MLTSLKRRIINQPYFLFLLTGIILIITTFFTFGQSVDLYLGDTYFLVAINYFIWALAGLFLIAWTVYKLTNKSLWTKKLTWTHVLTTIFVLIFF